MTSPVTIDVLRERQGWTLAQKIDHSLGVIDQFVSRMGGRCFVSCSFGKDSLVTLDLVRMILPGVKAVWVNTGVEHPSVVRLANRRISEGDNVTVLRPEMTFREVVEKYGFPLVSKETAYKISQIRRNPDCGSSRKFMEDRDSKFCLPKRWMWLVGEDFDTSDKCCSVLKKRPMRKYIRSSGLAPILGTMASESEMRKGHYVRNGGCNVWNSTAVPLPPPYNAECKPLSIWMDKDVFEYCDMRGIELPEAYTKEGCDRTGCVACGFGITRKGDDRLDILYRHYPKYYAMIMDYKNNGVTYREAVRKVLESAGKTLPDERPQTLFDT